MEALLEFFLGPGSLVKSAPTNTAARLLGGDTTHASYKLPRGAMVGRRAQFTAPVLRAFRRRWACVKAHAIGEISVFPPRALLHVDLRCRQAKQQDNDLFGGLATCLSGDFLQLPPVEEPSLALPLGSAGYAQDFGEALPAGSKDEDVKRKERQDFEHRAGFELWRDSFTVVTCLSLNMRTTGMIAEILHGMRAGILSDAAWHALQSRVLGHCVDDAGNKRRLPDGVPDPRLGEPPFSTNMIQYIVHRHQLRVCQAFRNAAVACAAASQTLYVSVACDDLVEGPARLTDDVREILLKRNNLRLVKNLPATLPLYRGMRLLLYSKLCVRLQLMNGCLCILEDIFFLRTRRRALTPFASGSL